LSTRCSVARRDDRVVVGDLGVVDHAAERQHVEPEHVLRPLRVLAVLADVGGRLDLAAMSPAGSASSCAGR
jgi:hypothetical protein